MSAYGLPNVGKELSRDFGHNVMANSSTTTHNASCLVFTHLRDTLPVLPPVKRRPGNPPGVLALEEQAFALAILESEDLAVAADVEFTLFIEQTLVTLTELRLICKDVDKVAITHLARVDLLTAESIVVRPHCGGCCEDVFAAMLRCRSRSQFG